MFIYFHPDANKHVAPIGHPECAERMLALKRRLEQSPVNDRLEWKRPGEANLDPILAMHARHYVEDVEKLCSGLKLGEQELLDTGDTWVVGDSFHVARLAVGAGLAAVDAVLQGASKRAFVALRPPGHHARPEAAMGFCIFGNASIAARYAQRQHGIRRVAIIDWDVHHGNGTQEMFYNDGSVLFFSTHQNPHWPFTGLITERGAGEGAGKTINVPMRVGSAGPEFEKAFQEILKPAIDLFKPELFIISAGFDAHTRDPLGDLDLTDDDFRKLTEMVMEMADVHAEGRIVSFLEGGYNLETMPGSVEAHLDILSG